MAIELYYTCSSTDIVEDALRLYLQSSPAIRGVVFDIAGVTAEARWPTRSRLIRLEQSDVDLPDDPYFRHIAERVSNLLDGRGFCLQPDQEGDVAVIRVVPKGE